MTEFYVTIRTKFLFIRGKFKYVLGVKQYFSVLKLNLSEDTKAEGKDGRLPFFSKEWMRKAITRFGFNIW